MLDDVVGVTDYCPLPQSHDHIPRMGGLMDPNTERIFALRATLAFHAPTARTFEARLAETGVKVVPLPNESLADIYASIATAGKELGLEEKAGDLIAEIQNDMEQLSREFAGKDRPSILYVIGHTPGSLRNIHAVGPGTFLEELLIAAGGNNHMANSPTSYPQVSREELIQRPPDVILAPTQGDAWSEADAEHMRREWMALLGPSGSRTRVVFLEDSSLSIPGPYVHRSARRLAEAIRLAARNGWTNDIVNGTVQE